MPTARGYGSGGGDDADLLQEAEGVPDFPRLGDLAALHAMDADGVDAYLLAGGGDAVHLTHVGAAARPPHDDAVIRREDLLDAPVAFDVLLVHADELGHALGTLARRRLRVVHLVVGGQQLGGQLVLSLVVPLL